MPAFQPLTAPLTEASLPSSVLIACALAALVSFLIGRLIIRHAARLGLQDLPNDRSSHERPTPRGGGAGIVVAFLLAIACCLPPGWPDGWPIWLPLAAAVTLALIGFVDDRRGLGLGIRLAVQLLAVAAMLLALAAGAPSAAESDIGVLAAVTGLPSLSAWLPAALSPAIITALDIVVVPLLLVGGVWWINLFNFMDGIDGLAALQALFMLLAGLAIKATGPGVGFDFNEFIGTPTSATSLVLAAAVAGFLLLNWAPARVFMGDAGSLFLGFFIFATAAHDVTYGDMSLWAWLILGGLFLVDASLTLVRRWFTGQSVTAAHRSHLYQRLSRRWGKHSTVALVYCLVNVTWIFPLALLAHRVPPWAPMILVLAWMPPAVVAWRAGAGLKET